MDTLYPICTVVLRFSEAFVPLERGPREGRISYRITVPAV
jgi:hypothetical protein